MSATQVTVNGKSVEQYLGEQKSREIQRFLAQELRGFKFATSRHNATHSTSNVNRVVRYEADGRAVLK